MAYKQIIQLKGNQGYYFPLFNKYGMRSSISPFMAGDVKRDQHRFALEPISELGLYMHGLNRNVIFEINHTSYFLNGMTERQQDDKVTLEVDLLYQRVSRSQSLYNIETTSYVAADYPFEVHQVIYTNQSSKPQKLKITTAIPLYAKSADHIRDHRHVTSLFNRIYVTQGRISVKPTMQFDEHGHRTNHTSYHMMANSQLKIAGYIPTIKQFIANGSIAFPRGLNNIVEAPYTINGYEAMGGIQFESVMLEPGASVTLYCGIAITETEDVDAMQQTYLNHQGFAKGLNKVKDEFSSYARKLSFSIGNQALSDRVNWMVIQPLLRRYYGNSFLPHHDYGKGGKGWRDLWQDLLSLIMMGDDHVADLLEGNFQGLRLDGSNATIIGDKPGEFLADRNKIVRVWSDHGVWPLWTVKQYLDETGDMDFLNRKVPYFHDQFTHYTHQIRQIVPIIDYEGTILEHLLLENLVGFNHRGMHGFTRLEDADWNDGNDMAKELGETIAFTHMYTNNVFVLADLIERSNQQEIVVFKALKGLIDGTVNIKTFFDDVAQFDKQLVILDSTYVSQIMRKQAILMVDRLKNTFEDDRFQSYYDECGKLFDSKDTACLTGQAMALLSKTASDNQAKILSRRIRELLFEETIGGYHLNSKYDNAHMGRAYGFAYNHKENGAIFSHMNVMYAYGLYQYNLVSDGHEAAFTLLRQAQKQESGVLLGIPEYFTEKGIGMYPYLTGSASWFLKLLRDEVFGLSFNLGILSFKPKLINEDFIDGKASIHTIIFNHLVHITYINQKNLSFGQYKIAKIVVDGREVHNKFKTIGNNVEVYLDEIL